MAITLLQPFNLDSTKDFTFSTVNVTNTTSSTDSTTGGLVVAGGVGIAGNVNIATNLTVGALSNLGNVGNIKITGGSSGQFLQTDGTGNIVWATVNASAIFNGTSNVSVPSANGNVTIGVSGNANVVTFTGSGANVNGYVSANTFTSNIATGTAPLIVYSTTRVSNLNVSYANVSDYSNVITQTTGVFYPTFISGAVSGNYQLGANANITYNAATHTLSTENLEGTIQTGAQPNITSVGNLVSLNVIGNIDAANVNVTNELYVEGNVYAPYFVGNVDGNISGTITGTIGAPGSNTEVLFNTDEVIDASPAFTFNKTSNTLTVANTIDANYVSVGQNLTVTANIDGGNISTGGTLSVTGNATINGNLTVNGTTIYANVTALTVKDPIITIGGDTTGAPLVSNDGKDRGTILKYHDGTNPVDAFMGWDNSNAEFLFGKNTSVSGEVISVNELGNIRANNIYANVTGAVSGNFSGNITLPSGGNTQIIFNDEGQAGSSNKLTFNKDTNALTLAGNIHSTNANLGNTVIANYFSGNGSYLTGLNGSNITSQVGNALIAGTVYTNAQPNITSVGTLSSLSVTGNVTSGNANLGNVATANFFVGDGGLLSNISGGSVGLVANANYAAYAGNVVNASQPNITSVGNLSSLRVTGNLRFDTGISANGNFGTLGQVLTSMGDNTAKWTSQFYVGNVPPQLFTPAVAPNYGDIWYYVDDTANPPTQKLYMWVSDGTSSYYYDFLPPTG